MRLIESAAVLRIRVFELDVHAGLDLDEVGGRIHYTRSIVSLEADDSLVASVVETRMVAADAPRRCGISIVGGSTGILPEAFAATARSVGAGTEVAKATATIGQGLGRRGEGLLQCGRLRLPGS